MSVNDNAPMEETKDPKKPRQGGKTPQKANPVGNPFVQQAANPSTLFAPIQAPSAVEINIRQLVDYTASKNSLYRGLALYGKS